MHSLSPHSRLIQDCLLACAHQADKVLDALGVHLRARIADTIAYSGALGISLAIVLAMRARRGLAALN